MGGVSTATLQGTGGQSPPLIYKLVSLHSAQCAITSDFCGFSLLIGLLVVFGGVPSEKGVTSAALLS